MSIWPALDSDLVAMVLARVSQIAWVVRLVDRRFRDSIEPARHNSAASAATSGERAELAMRLGLQAGALCRAAAAVGNIQVLESLERTTDVYARALKAADGRALQAAARGGHLAAIKWLSRRIYVKRTTLVADAARGGHQHVLDYLCVVHGHGVWWDRTACRAAARGGHLEVLRRLRDCGYGWDKTTCTYAAASGCLEVLEWAHSQGCPCSYAECRSAARTHPRVLEWLERRMQS